MTDQTNQQPANTDRVRLAAGRYLIEYDGQLLYFRPRNQASIVLLLSRALAENKPYILECDGDLYVEKTKTIKNALCSPYHKFDFEII